ncbi:MAG: division plane positioning ATPase MipZ [Phenylobacterium sp.]
MPQASVIVVGNEKGGAGKSTIAIHTATALLHGEAKVAVLDLDLRQQSTAHFFANRRAWLDANGATAPMPIATSLDVDLAKASEDEALARFQDAFAKARDEADFVLIDTPGSDTATSRAAHGLADLIAAPSSSTPRISVALATACAIALPAMVIVTVSSASPCALATALPAKIPPIPIVPLPWAPATALPASALPICSSASPSAAPVALPVRRMPISSAPEPCAPATALPASGIVCDSEPLPPALAIAAPARLTRTVSAPRPTADATAAPVMLRLKRIVAAAPRLTGSSICGAAETPKIEPASLHDCTQWAAVPFHELRYLQVSAIAALNVRVKCRSAWPCLRRH